jgi:hypothetical protein
MGEAAMSSTTFAIASAAAIALAGAAWADEDAGQPLRLLGDAPAIGEAGPAHFVIDALVKPGFDRGEADVTGWFASAAPPATDSGELQGKCIDGHCELTVDLDSRKIALIGDLIGRTGPVQGRFEVSGDLAADKLTKGAASFTPFADTVPGLGELVGPGAIDSEALDDLLLWAGIKPAFGDDQPHPLEDFQHEHLASWQQDNARPVNGLLFTADLALLKAQRDKAQKDVGWKSLGGGDLGWSAGYPDALLPLASRNGGEQRFASTDGKAELVVAIDPPLSDADFDALGDKLSGGGGDFNAKWNRMIHQLTTPDPTNRDYARSNGDMRISYVDGGKAVSQVFYNRKGGLARLIFTYPDGDNPFSAIDSIITYSLRASDDMKPRP